MAVNESRPAGRRWASSRSPRDRAIARYLLDERRSAREPAARLNPEKTMAISQRGPAGASAAVAAPLLMLITPGAVALRA